VQLASETIENFLVPKHVLLSKSDTEELLKKTGFRLEEMPQILSSDPAIKNLRAEKDDVIKIIRISQTAGKTIYYRRVI
jgi:DNA-directed RNA polymerase subunit H (RpoH/RPB5)